MSALTVVLKTLADTNRLRILALLAKRRMCVCELAFVLGVTQPSISRHLKKLASAGLTAGEQNGFWTDYYLLPEPDGTEGLIRTVLERFGRESAARRDRERAVKADRRRLCCRPSGNSNEREMP